MSQRKRVERLEQLLPMPLEEEIPHLLSAFLALGGTEEEIARLMADAVQQEESADPPVGGGH